MLKECDVLLKIVIVGNSGVGKSSLLLRFTDDQFTETYYSTIGIIDKIILGVDFRFRTLKVEDKQVKLQIWDTAGQERFRTITSSYYQGASGILLVFDLTDEKSIEDVEKFWIEEVERFGDKNVVLMLFGNKCDLPDRKITNETIQEVCSKRKIIYNEVSAKTADNVTSGFETLVKTILKKRAEKKLDEKAEPVSASAQLNSEGGAKTGNESCC